MNEFIEAITPALIDALALIIAALAGYLITYINKKKKALEVETDNEKTKAYLDIIEKTIVDCVNATNQTFVETLKKEGKFTKEAQEEAFNKTLQSVKAILSKDCLEYLSLITTDVNTYIYNKIEAEVKNAKK